LLVKEQDGKLVRRLAFAQGRGRNRGTASRGDAPDAGRSPIDMDRIVESPADVPGAAPAGGAPDGRPSSVAGHFLDRAGDDERQPLTVWRERRALGALAARDHPAVELVEVAHVHPPGRTGDGGHPPARPPDTRV